MLIIAWARQVLPISSLTRNRKHRRCRKARGHLHDHGHFLETSVQNFTEQGPRNVGQLFRTQISDRLEHGAKTDIPTPLFHHFAAARSFEVNISVGSIRQIEVGAEPVFNPAAAEIVGNM